jgi:hypothetical protein
MVRSSGMKRLEKLELDQKYLYLRQRYNTTITETPVSQTWLRVAKMDSAFDPPPSSLKLTHVFYNPSDPLSLISVYLALIPRRCALVSRAWTDNGKK